MNQRIGDGSTCHCQSDISWLNNTLNSGTVAPGDNEEIVFTFDTAGLASGTYDAHVRIGNDTPYGPIYLPVTLNLIASQHTAEPGDVNHSGHLDLTDVILSLKVVTGERLLNVIISPDADVNGDKRIGVAEAVYVMRVLAHMP